VFNWCFRAEIESNRHNLGFLERVLRRLELFCAMGLFLGGA